MVTHSFIAIFGGSFDPIHNGHIELAEMVSQLHPGTEIYFVPCGNPVHRAPFFASAMDRIAMIERAIDGHTHWHIDTFEVDSAEPSYTINTLRHFKQKFPEASLGFIMGMDSFLSIETWGNWQELLNYAHLLVSPRKSYDENLLHKKHNDSIIMLPVAPQSVSSTEIRKKLIHRDDVSSLILKAVYDYIEQQKLYF